MIKHYVRRNNQTLWELPDPSSGLNTNSGDLKYFCGPLSDRKSDGDQMVDGILLGAVSGTDQWFSTHYVVISGILEFRVQTYFMEESLCWSSDTSIWITNASVA